MSTGLRIKDVGNSGVSMAELIKIDSGSGDGAAHDNIACKKSSTETFSVDVNGLPATTSGDQYQYLTVNIGDVAADSDAIVPVIIVPKAQITIISIGLSVDTSVDDDDANYQSINFEDGDSNEILSADFTTDIAWTAGLVQDCGTLDNTHKIIPANKDVSMTFTKTLVGKAFSGMKVHIVYTYSA